MDLSKVLNTTNDYNRNYYGGVGYTKFDDYINNKYDNIHENLYKDALSKLKSKLNLSDNEYTFIEIKNSEFNKPSSVKVTRKVYPFITKTYDLTKYWNPINYRILKNKKLSDIKMSDEKINDWSIKYIDYARGKVIIYSKMYDIEKEANFDDVNYGEFQMLKEETLSNTFTVLRKNNNLQ